MQRNTVTTNAEPTNAGPGDVARAARPKRPMPRSVARFVTVAEVAEQLRVSNMTVYRLVQAGELPAVRVGRSYRIREDDVDGYLSKRYTEAG